jgi:hypothetical protein
MNSSRNIYDIEVFKKNIVKYLNGRHNDDNILHISEYIFSTLQDIKHHLGRHDINTIIINLDNAISISSSKFNCSEFKRAFDMTFSGLLNELNNVSILSKFRYNEYIFSKYIDTFEDIKQYIEQYLITINTVNYAISVDNYNFIINELRSFIHDLNNVVISIRNLKNIYIQNKQSAKQMDSSLNTLRNINKSIRGGINK